MLRNYVGRGDNFLDVESDNVVEFTETVYCGNSKCKKPISDGQTALQSGEKVYCSQGCQMIDACDTGRAVCSNFIQVKYKGE